MGTCLLTWPELLLADFLPHFLGDLLQHLRIVPAAPAAPQPVTATHLFTQTASAAMLSNEGLILEDVPPFTQYTAFSKDGEHMLSSPKPLTGLCGLCSGKPPPAMQDASVRHAGLPERGSSIMHMHVCQVQPGLRAWLCM